MVQRLLAFARRQHLEAVAVDVRQLVTNMGEMLTRTLGPRITIAMQIPKGLPAARVDPNQLEVAILNLTVNARDAMPEGGTLRIMANLVSIEQHPMMRPGEYIKLSVSDTGVGMAPETLRRAFEPFYTTKPPGQGTGLGVSMVHGLTVQSGGDFTLESEVGKGTTACLWLPITYESPEDAVSDNSNARDEHRQLTVLLVDDEKLVRLGASAMLSEAGYNVIEASSGAEALHIVKAGVNVDAVVTDFAMPGMTGLEMAKEIRKVRDGMPVLMITGYASLREGDAVGVRVLSKPFREAELTSAVAEILDRSA